MTHTPRKRFGQNFLNDAAVIAHIIATIRPIAGERIIEIGPGLGALTKPLLQHVQQLTIIEIDRDLQNHWHNAAEAAQLNIIAADALTVDYGALGRNLRIIGNLPYNIATPLLFHLLKYREHIDDMVFMLQKEVVERMVARPGSKAYGKLSVMLQYQCEIAHLFNVPGTAFYPQPKVESAIVRLQPRQHQLLVDLPTLQACVASSFAMRRKTLNNNLKMLISAENIRQLGIDPTARPEQLSVNDFVRIANTIAPAHLRH